MKHYKFLIAKIVVGCLIMSPLVFGYPAMCHKISSALHDDYMANKPDTDDCGDHCVLYRWRDWYECTTENAPQCAYCQDKDQYGSECVIDGIGFHEDGDCCGESPNWTCDYRTGTQEIEVTCRCWIPCIVGYDVEICGE